MSQGKFHVERHIDGRVMITCPPVMIVAPEVAIQMARAILNHAGVETVLAEPGQTVIRPPRNGGLHS